MPALHATNAELPVALAKDHAARARLLRRHAKMHRESADHAHRGMADFFDKTADELEHQEGLPRQRPMADDEYAKIFGEDELRANRDKFKADTSDNAVESVRESLGQLIHRGEARHFAEVVRDKRPAPTGLPLAVRQRIAEADKRIARDLQISRLQEQIRKLTGPPRRPEDRHDREIARLARELKESRNRRRFLVECSCDDGLDADAQEPIIRGVKVLGADSLNRRKYTQQAMTDALPMYEGCKVYLNHPKVPTESRDVEALFGRLHNPRLDGNAVVADLYYNPRHPRAGQILWAAKHDPGSLGLSHNAVGTGKTVDGVFVVEHIHSVRSVDLVADPASTGGLLAA